MKHLIPILFLLSATLFVDYVIFALIGCIAGSMGAGEIFYCGGVYCKIGISVFAISIVMVSAAYGYYAKRYHNTMIS